MQCQRLKKLARDWYQMVKEDALAPARMMELIERHVQQCPVCQTDPDLPEEIEKIREIIRAPQPVVTIEE
ncbi:hypothetical protein [Thermodesulfatator autotrophicus]|uniref:Uncharacterized protein n=1 Tax=Thermodesulfatator autotrophicus TaxID=1795632 RepID=A0A177E861_9BACT|nr:hypothetical protein [Thermodesulfatator autotrophicus]OAG27209.1 hypothetical protein TH606_07970 [Thermodesulfatator autotrophicus]